MEGAPPPRSSSDGRPGGGRREWDDLGPSGRAGGRSSRGDETDSAPSVTFTVENDSVGRVIGRLMIHL